MITKRIPKNFVSLDDIKTKTYRILFVNKTYLVIMLLLGVGIGALLSAIFLKPRPIFGLPQTPIVNIKVPKGHVEIIKDNDGYYWTEPMNLDKWSDCFKCHAGRWTQAGGLNLTQRLEYVKNKEFFPENPK